MVTLRQAAEQAIEALERADKISGYPNNAAAIKALRQALEAEQQAETCKACGEGQADLAVLRICDKCGSEYAGQAEFDLAMQLQAERQDEPSERPFSGLPLVIAGAIFDFAGFLTTRPNTIEVGSTANAAPMADLVKEWAELRGLSLDDAAVLSWQELLHPNQQPAQQPLNLNCKSVQKRLATLWGFVPAQQPLTEEQIRQIEAAIWKPEWLDETERESNREFARAIERAHGIGGAA